MAPSETDDPMPEMGAAPVDYEARMKWPYLAGFHAGGGVTKNGRELGCWIAGHLYGRVMHGEPGLRIQMRTEDLAGASAVLLDFGLTIQRWSRDDPAGQVTIDVWSA